MHRYNISYEYSQDGRSWYGSSIFVNATSDQGAIMQVQSRYPYVRNVRINSVS